MEIWKDVIGYEGIYSVSSLGNIKSNDRIVVHGYGGDKLLNGINRKQVKSTSGYLTIVLSKYGVSKRHSVHRIVLSSFIGEPIEKSDCCHLDGVRTNNSLSNLRWDSRKGNMADTVSHGTRRSGEKINFAKLTKEQVIRIIVDPRKQKAIADEYGICQSAVSLIKNKARWKHLI